MRLWIAALFALVALCAEACGQGQVLVPTRPLGDNSNAAASTAFVFQNNAVPPSGTTCPPTAGLNLYQQFVNTTGAPTAATLNIWDGAQCVPWASLNQTTHIFTFGSSSTNLNVGGPGTSFNLIGQGAGTTVTGIFQPTSPVTGRAYGLVGQIQGNGTGGQKVGVYGAANNTGSNGDDVWGGNFLAEWNATTPDINVQGVEIDFNNLKSNTFSLAKNGLSINSGGTFQGGNAISIASTTGSNQWNVGLVMAAWNTAGIVLGNASATGAISAKQLTNNTDTVLLQRQTDGAPTGQFLRAVNAANNTNLFLLDVSANLTTAGAIVSTAGNISTSAGTITANKSGASGNTGVAINSTQTQANASDTADNALSLSYTLTANTATNELVARVLQFSFTNNLTGGGAISNGRLINVATNTNTSTTTSNLDSIYLEAGTQNGTVTTGRAIHIASIQGTNKFGIADDSGASWYNATGGLFLGGSTSAGNGNLTITGAFKLNGATSGNVQQQASATGGHLNYAGSGSAPTLTAGCNGAGSSVVGTDIAGTVTGQTAAATTCTLTFGTAFSAVPNCVAAGQTSPLTGAFTPATGTLVTNFASTANYKWSYVCYGA